MLQYLPYALSSYASDIDHIIRVIYYLVGAWFIVAEGLLFWFVFSSRAVPGRRASWLPGKGAAAWAVLGPVVAVLACDFVVEAVSTPTWEHVKVDMPESNYPVKIEARQFAWVFTYPGADGELRTNDDIVSKELHVPVDEVVRFELEAADVLHAFWVPELRLKQDAVPGRSIPGWFDTNKVGTYEIACAEICGKGHTDMKSLLVVDSKEGFTSWLATQ